MSCNVTTITRACGPNTPGLEASVRLFLASSVLYLPRPVQGIIAANLLLQGSVATWAYSRYTGRYREQRRRDNTNGDYYQQTINLLLPKDRPQLIRAHYELRNVKLSALVTDRNGITRLVHNMLTSSDFDSGGNSGINAYTWELTSESPEPAFHFTGNLTFA